ncbi:Cytochrome c-556 [Pelagimonas phthalicica]|uniref:Cytochrome c-556 n=1 Tax=Pelagimonas phthalicica TaxID=1037362 RepID=A0A238JAJ8_9RHOB|nr:cytochrome c [Pelagimonas phthalicica]TDS93746.1 cytochrome c556 [Pelagimonas phthalicica]SMX27730.1 Cytochrome c-556 [Pelagimonas phthalicica]
MKLTKTPLAMALLIAGIGSVALAHGGVKNAAVMARMNGMTSISEAMKVLGAMAKGQTQFDAETARAAAKDVATLSAQIPDLFQAPETDPKTEALPVIWERFDAFTALAQNTEASALALSQSLTTPDDLTAGLAQLGATCKACHKEYRK